MTCNCTSVIQLFNQVYFKSNKNKKKYKKSYNIKNDNIHKNKGNKSDDQTNIDNIDQLQILQNIKIIFQNSKIYIKTRMTTFRKTKFKKSDNQTNIDRNRVAANITEYEHKAISCKKCM